MSFASFGTGGASVDYITREKAAAKISFVKLPELRAETQQEQRENAIAYSDLRMEVEKSKRRDARTNYKLLLSWDRKELSETADRMATEFVERNFPTAKAIVAVHQDTEHTHAHIWIDARGTNEKKLHFKKNEWQTIDERWHRAFDEEYGTDYFTELKTKKLETAAYKKAKAQGRAAVKPLRAEDVFDHAHWRNKEIQNLTGERIPTVEHALTEAALINAAKRIIRKPKENEKIGLGNDQRFTAAENDASGRSESAAALPERNAGTAKRLTENAAERFERERRFTQTVLEPLRSESSINRRSTKRTDAVDQSIGTREPLDYREYRAFESGKAAIRSGGNAPITGGIAGGGDQENAGSGTLPLPGAFENPERNQSDQPQFDLDGKAAENSRRGTEQNQPKRSASDAQRSDVFYQDVLDSQGTGIVTSQLEDQKVLNEGFYQSGFREHSKTGESDTGTPEKLSGENEHLEIFDQPVTDAAEESSARQRYKEDYFYKTEVITVSDQQSGTLVTEIVAASEAALRTSELLIGQPPIFQNYQNSNTLDNPFAGLPVNDSSMPGIQPEAWQSPAANASEIQQMMSVAAVESLAAADSTISFETTETSRLNSETDTLLAGCMTLSGGELQALDSMEEAFEISEEIELKDAPRQQSSDQREPEEIDPDYEQDDHEQMDVREDFGGFSL